MLNYLEKPLTAARPDRRTFVTLSAGAVGGLLIGARLPGSSTGAAAKAQADSLVMPFVHISPDNMVTVIAKHLDKGQGSATGLATLVAEELDASIAQMRVDFAPADVAVYKNFAFGVQGTGGSTAMANSFEQYRRAGATARAMLMAAAAAEWGVAAGEITIDNGVLSHGSGKSAPLGDLAARAGGLDVPKDAPLKAPAQWRYIGKEFPRIELAQKTTGSVGLYGMDVQMEDMLVAVTARPPRFGGTVKRFNADAARNVRGVVDVIQIPQGVSVLATSTWPAIKARDLLEIEWDFSQAEQRSSATMIGEYRALLDKPGTVAVARGDSAAALKDAAHVIEADYVFPYLAHTPMEPIDVTVQFDGSTATFWHGSQLQTLDQNVAAAVLGISAENVRINTLWAGGSFGRRAIYDSHYVAEAATIARVSGRRQPIKLVYTREDDVKGGYYRPLHVHRVRAGVDAGGNIVGWEHRIVGQSMFKGTAFEAFIVKDGVDHSSIEGIDDMTYRTAALNIDVHHPDNGTPTLWWRSVGHTHTAYVVETMIDELASAAGLDPVDYRLDLLHDDPRKAAVLRLAAEKAGWHQPPPAGRSRGVAVHKSFGSIVAEIAEISMNDDGTVKLERVTCAVDCGVPINPDIIRAQVQGAVGYGLSAILREELSLTDGEVDQSNFYDYMPLRMSDMPRIDVHIVPSSVAPTGIGEPGTPPIGPALANAIARATNKRVRELPMARHGLVS